jgi:phosphinothricin acetyltransferase
MDAAGQIREAVAGDGAAFAEVYAPYVRDTVISFELQPPSAEEMSRRIEAIGLRHPWLAAEQGGQVLGYAYGCEHRSRAAYRWDVDAGIYLAASAQGRGIGRRLYLALFEILRRQGYINAYAGITLPNAASVGLHESLGFSPVGIYRNVGYKHGAWHDVGWWALGLQPLPPQPQEPVPYPDFDPATLRRILAAA